MGKRNTFIITVRDEEVASRILQSVPWAVMKHNFVVKRWPLELALEEVQMEIVLFWVQIRGFHYTSIRRTMSDDLLEK